MCQGQILGFVIVVVGESGNSSGEVIYMLNTLYLEGHFYGFLNEESWYIDKRLDFSLPSLSQSK